MQFAHAHTDDPLGLAIAGDIVLVDVSGGVRKNYVEMMSELGIYIPSAAHEIRPVTEYQISYELRSSTLTVPLGVLINTDYVITALAAASKSDGYPNVNATVIKFSSPDKYLAPATAPSAIAISGGFGLVNKWGLTSTDGISSNMSISMQSVDALEETSGDYLEDGYTQYGFKQDVTFESYSLIASVPSGGKLVSRDAKTGRNGLKTHSLNFFKYL